MLVKFWGTRGSIPVPGKYTFKYGGNTPCVEIRTDEDELIILDAGSGIRELGKSLPLNTKDNNIPVLLSHYHWDHIQGIPFFRPLFNKDNNITFFGLTVDGSDVKTVLSNQMIPNHFPIEISGFDADVKFKSVEPNSTYNIKDITVETFRCNHTTDTLTYKIISGKKSVVYMPDNEILLKDQNQTKHPMIL